MVVGDGHGCAGGLAAERRGQPDAAVYLCAVGTAVLGEQILTCQDIWENTAIAHYCYIILNKDSFRCLFCMHAQV